eukprot:247940-Pyramimonas_sp.AAC.1
MGVAYGLCSAPCAGLPAAPLLRSAEWHDNMDNRGAQFADDTSPTATQSKQDAHSATHLACIQ